MLFLLMTLAKESMLIIILSSLPAILASLVVGLLVAIFSATTQIQEQTLSFAPKMIAVYLALLAFCAPIGSMLLNFAKNCFGHINKL